ncbi:hypothetical protein, variant 2 [Aphanomyces astaci]|nr:hypothetical protein, variant 2 [Aphanomyces astaci]ETV82196.1 hypothetical protein, variant 2 [Aphanomyces astaci]|eukprot:XP_009827865.1 hypothetical protein, variant 2 [Aphanomyces astaci]
MKAPRSLPRSTLPPPAATTLIHAFQRTVQRYGYQKAVHVKWQDKWHSLTWRQYYTRVQEFMKSLIHVGIQPHDVVAISGLNAIEWNVAYLGTIMAGGAATGMYVNSSKDLSFFIAHHSEARVIVCDSVDSVEKFVSIQPSLPHLKAIVLWGHDLPSTYASSLPVYCWQPFLEQGLAITKGTVRRRMQAITAGQCASIVYTSGTGGTPKGVMISHDNFCFNAWAMEAAATSSQLSHRDVLVSYLPLAHVTAQLVDIVLPLWVGYEVYFAPVVRNGPRLGKTLKEIRPTRFCGIPSVWDTMAVKFREVQGATSGLKKHLVSFATSRAWKKTVQSQYGSTGASPCGAGIAEKLVLSKVKAALGLDRCKSFSVTWAPLRRETTEYYGGLDMPILAFFGASETTGVATINMQYGWKLHSVGRPLPGTEIRLQKQSTEILVRGRHVMMGYLKNEAETRLVLDTEGWLRSGDGGAVDDDGFYSISGPLHELVTTAGGAVIAPVSLETVLKRTIPILSHAMVIGQQREFLLALFTLRVESDEADRPTDKLEMSVRTFLSSIRSNATTLAQAQTCPKLATYLDSQLRQVNKATSKLSFGNFIQKFVLLPREFSVEGGELTPTLKVRRQAVCDIHHGLIESTYA